jgi:hypothetical protein
MIDESVRLYAEFAANYLPDLFNYVVPILNGNKELGSGVLVNWQGRHLVATARHCIENKPRVFRPTSRLEQNKNVTTHQLRILRTEWHDTLDIGYLETDDPDAAELGADQLCNDRIADGMAHIVGFPTIMARVDWPNRNISICGGSFSTTLVEETDDFLKFDYPKQGSRYDPATGGWRPSTFPETPHGFSGGGCFGVVSGAAGSIRTVAYKLLGIQASWSSDGRWVKVVPIKHLSDLLACCGHRKRSRADGDRCTEK